MLYFHNEKLYKVVDMEQIQKKESCEMVETVALKLLSQCGGKFIQILKAEGKLGDGQGANSGSVANDTDAKLLKQSQGKKD